MPTTAKKTFNLNIQRASYFLDIHEATQPGAGAPSLPRRELPRGAIVFAVGAIDAYLSEVSAEVIVTCLQRAAPPADLRDVLKQVQVEIPTLSLEVALLASRQDRIDHLRNAILAHFHNRVSNVGAKAVAATLRRVGRKASDFWAEVARRYPDPAQQLDYWTDIRHEIVHQGKKPTVRRAHARDFIDLAKHIVGTLDKYALQAASAPAA